MGSTGNKRFRYAIYALVLTIVYMACSYIFTSLYLVYDDCAMRSIAAGDMTGIPDGHVMFMNYVTGAALAALYGVSRAFDWYVVFYLFAISIALWAFLYKCLIISEGHTWIRRIAVTGISVLLFASIFHILIVKLTYTTVASILAVVILFYYALTGELRISDVVILTLMSVICFAIRYETFLMFSPYVAFIIIYRIYKASDRGECIKRNMPLWILILFGVGVLYLVDRTAYTGEYENIRELNYYRSEIQDKGGLPSYGSHKDLYDSLGISEEEYDLLGISWGLCESFTLENMKTIVEAGEYDDVTVASIVRDIGISIKDELRTDYKFLFCLLFVIMLTMLICRRDWPYLILVAASLLTALAECAYILSLRRALDDRLIYSFSLAVLIQCIIYLYDLILRGDKERSYKMMDKVGVTALTVVLILACASLIRFCKEEDNGRGWIYATESYYMEHPDTLFLTSGITSDEKVKIRKPMRRNYIKLNGWVTEMPQFDTSIAGLYMSALDGLAYRDDIVLVCGEDEINIILEYMRIMGYNELSATRKYVDIDDVGYEFWRIVGW